MRPNKLDLEHECQLHAHPLGDGVGTITRTILDDNVEQPRDCFTRFFIRLEEKCLVSIRTDSVQSIKEETYFYCF